VGLELLVVETPEEGAEEAARRLAPTARAGAAIALSGGSTPRRAYERAAASEPDWSAASLWLVDERVVSLDDERSNARLVRETLLDRLVSKPSFHLVRTELGPEEAAAAYDQELDDARLGLVLLGIGPDGHTASLFPNAPALHERERRVVAAEAGLEPRVPRVTMTIPALSAAQDVLFLVTGSDKADAVRRAFEEAPSPATPASLVRSLEGTTTAILDAAAAASLSDRTGGASAEGR
jgi:6-phosphogluconolactonase